jgi:hypothetical protein
MDGFWQSGKLVEGITGQDSPGQAFNAVEQPGIVTVIQEYDRVSQSSHGLRIGM